MKTLVALQLLFLLGNLFAQEDSYHASLKSTLQTQYGITGGTWVFPPNEIATAANTSCSGGTRTLMQITGQHFTKATQLAIATVPQNPWSAGMKVDSEAKVALRRFKGVYKVTIQTGTEAFVDTVNLTADSALAYKQPFVCKSGFAEINGKP